MRSPIEQKFSSAAAAAGLEFDEETQVSRYRVDFIDHSRKLVIELDGHEGHKSKQDRTYDAQRDRQLHREGYTVLRFTGSEIWSDVDRCIEEVKQTLALWEPQPTPEGAIYIDWQFVDRSASTALSRYRRQYPGKELDEVRLSALLDFAARYLQLDGRFDVHLFGTASSFSQSIVQLDALKLRVAANASFFITEHQHEFIAPALVEHLYKEGTRYNHVYLIADDAAYPPLLNRGRALEAIIRRDNDSTSMVALGDLRWQDIDYIVGYSLGLKTHEL